MSIWPNPVITKAIEETFASATRPPSYKGPQGETGPPGPPGPAGEAAPAPQFSTYGMINFSEFSEFSPTRSADFDSELAIYLRRWNGAGRTTSPASARTCRLELEEFLAAFGIHFAWSGDAYSQRASSNTRRPLRVRAFDRLAAAALVEVPHNVVFWTVVGDLIQFRGLGDRL